MTIQPDGNMVVAGFTADEFNRPAMLVRYHAQPGRPRVKVTPVALGRRARVRIRAIDPARDVQVTLTAGATTLAKGRASLDGKRKLTLDLPLTRAGRRLVAKGRPVAVTATVVAEDGTGKKAQHQATRTLKV